MSFYSDASLVLIPSGYKDQKVYSAVPTDGSGDLVFSRASGATRVASNGLIEKVRTNLALYSEAFDNAWWSKSSITITANDTTDPFGGTAADKVLCSAGTTSPNTFSTGVACTSGVEYTASYYAKQGTSKYAKIRFSSTAFASATNSPIFDLNAGTVVSGTGTITSVGNGWYRISATQVAEASANGVFTVDIPSSTGVWPNGTFAGTEYIYIFGYQFETGVMTDYIATTSAAVSVGPVSGLPRLDYLGSTCPRLLLEPQRTNVATYSEQFNNSGWTKLETSVSANAGTSPDGYTNADKIIPNSTSTRHILYQAHTASSVHTLSVFAKAAGQNFLTMRLDDDTPEVNVFFNLSTGTIGSTAGGSPTMTSYGNGWYRCTVSYTPSGTETIYAVLGTANVDGTIAYSGNGTDGVLMWGAQLEAGAYATSYIPTLGSSVTRVRDLCEKFSISSILPQQTGTLYAEFDWQKTGDDTQVVSIDNTSNALAWIVKQNSTEVRGTYFDSGFIGQISGTVSASATKVKVAYAYTNGSQVLYVNGVQAGTATAAITNVVALSHLKLNGFWYIDKENTAIEQVLLFKTKLTNAQLAELTTL